MDLEALTSEVPVILETLNSGIWAAPLGSDTTHLRTSSACHSQGRTIFEIERSGLESGPLAVGGKPPAVGS